MIKFKAWIRVTYTNILKKCVSMCASAMASKIYCTRMSENLGEGSLGQVLMHLRMFPFLIFIPDINLKPQQRHIKNILFFFLNWSTPIIPKIIGWY